jgi:hypothetical protein
VIRTRAGDFEFHDALANDEHTVAMYVARGEREGETLEDMSVLVSHVRSGKLSETWQYFEDQYAGDEFLAESLDLAVHRLRGTLGTQCLRTLDGGGCLPDADDVVGSARTAMSASRSASKVMMLASYRRRVGRCKAPRESRGELAVRRAMAGGIVPSGPASPSWSPWILDTGRARWWSCAAGTNPLAAGGGSDGEDPVCDQLRL